MNVLSRNLKIIGSILILIAMGLAGITHLYTQQSVKLAHLACIEACGLEAEHTCPHTEQIPLQSYIAYTLTVILLGSGIFLFFTSKNYLQEGSRKNKEIQKAMKTLSEEESRIYKLVRINQGAVFQSELVEKSKLSKVKITRILDKLEGKRLIERKRRGMTNIVILK